MAEAEGGFRGEKWQERDMGILRHSVATLETN
jgi:hypothetical protein